MCKVTLRPFAFPLVRDIVPPRRAGFSVIIATIRLYGRNPHSRPKEGLERGIHNKFSSLALSERNQGIILMSPLNS